MNGKLKEDLRTHVNGQCPEPSKKKAMMGPDVGVFVIMSR